jgi:transcriptional regulator with XRE-family HTH domain
LSDNKGFDGNAFYRALKTVVSVRDLTWKQVAEETGVSASTLARMAQGRNPDAASLAAISAWAGLNPSDFVTAQFRPPRGQAIGQISSLLRSDPSLDLEAADALDAIVRTAYQRLKKS